MIVHYYYILIVTIPIILSQSIPCTIPPRFGQTQYSGHIEFQTDGSATLHGALSTTAGISFLVGCDGDISTIDLTVSLPDSFTVIDDTTRVGPGWKLIVLTDTFDLVANMDITFTLTACPTGPPDLCTSVPVTVTYPYNANTPRFLPEFGMATIPDADDCSAGCQLNFSPSFSCSDADGDVLEYSLIPYLGNILPYFTIPDLSSLNIHYVGQGLPQDTNITLQIQAKEKRQVDGRSVTALVQVEVQISATTPSTTTTTTTPAPAECDDKKEKLYFIIMIVLASVLGALLILLLLILICVKCCRSSTVPISKTRKATVKGSAVVTAGATFKSFSEMNYVTLQEPPPSYTSSQVMGARVENNGAGRMRSRPKASKRNRPANPDGWGKQGHSSDSTISVTDRRRDADA